MWWLAERFFNAGDGWIDAATGRAVNVHVCGADGDEVAWNDDCARLAVLRHPLLNPLVDYGAAGRNRRFEAYEHGAPVTVTFGANAETLVAHAARFLRAHEVCLTPERTGLAVRALIAGQPAAWRPIGIVLQRRAALAAVEESLDPCSPPGPATIDVSGSDHAGLRTLRVAIARSARLRGFVPVCAAAVQRRPEVVAALTDRHVCVLDDVNDAARSSAAVARLVSVVSTASARRHVVVRFHRSRSPVRGISLDGLSVGALIGMVFADDGELSPLELVAAARGADGLPGLFLARLSGGAWAPSGAMLVHERSPAFEVDNPAPPPAIIGGRILGGAVRAPARAAQLARTGRHASASRLLARAIRVLEGRGRTVEAAECHVKLGWLRLDRGDTAGARAAFARAQEVAAATTATVAASIGAGVTCTDERRLIEGEAILRGAAIAAEAVGDQRLLVDAAAALARCLLWQERAAEAAAIAVAYRTTPGPAAEQARLLAVHARALAQLGRTAEALRAAREAQQLAVTALPHVQASVELALGRVLASAGDIEGARAAASRAARTARAHHLPLFRVRTALLLASLAGTSAARRPRRIRRHGVPPLLASLLDAVARPAPAPLEPVAELEAFLDLSQRAADDTAAAGEICRSVASRVGASTVAIFSSDARAIAVHGRGWPAAPDAVAQVLAQRTAVRTDACREPREFFEPIRYGGDLIAVLASRWIAGAAVDDDGAGLLLRTAALSAGPHVRALLDRPEAPPPSAWADLLGESPPAVALREEVARAAKAPFPVLVEGESGCGKELVARAVHRLGGRRDRRFCALNCAALTDDLVESELFGHARGAFTGAAGERAGLFEEADGGTLFLDEVGELSARAQAKLLRVLQEGEVRRVGENFPRRVDVRVVAATNRRLEEEAAAGRFRTDLRFRLDVVRIRVPPLRDRASDIPLLAAHFWRDASARVGSRATLSPEALAALARYDWPGNVRELQNVVSWIAVQSPRRGRIGPSALPRHVAQAAPTTLCSFEAAREEFERRFVRAALAGANGQRARAAAALGVTRQGLSKMMRRLRIEGI